MSLSFIIILGTEFNLSSSPWWINCSHSYIHIEETLQKQLVLEVYRATQVFPRFTKFCWLPKATGFAFLTIAPGFMTSLYGRIFLVKSVSTQHKLQLSVMKNWAQTFVQRCIPQIFPLISQLRQAIADKNNTEAKRVSIFLWSEKVLCCPSFPLHLDYG